MYPLSRMGAVAQHDLVAVGIIQAAAAHIQDFTFGVKGSGERNR